MEMVTDVVDYLSGPGEDFDAVEARVLGDLDDDFFGLAGGFVEPDDTIEAPVGHVDHIL